MTRNAYSTRDFRLEDPSLNRRLWILVRSCYHSLSPRQAEITRLIFIRFKRYSRSEYHLYLVMAYAMVFFGMLPVEHPSFEERDQKALRDLLATFQYEMSGERDVYVQTMLELDDELFLLKLLIKYTVLLAEEEYGEFVPRKSEYYRALGWLIPILSYKNYEIIIPTLQDTYFRKLYPEEYAWARAMRETPTSSEFIENYMVDITNDLTSMMERLGIVGLMKLRKKSIFSLYNKMKTKGTDRVHDMVGLRIVFGNEEELRKFSSEVERHFIVKIKKDYVRNPKPNGYRGIHYTFLYTHRNCETEIELQIRTRAMDDEINGQDCLTHFAYSYYREKWNPLFREVREGAELVLAYAARKRALDIIDLPLPNEK